MSDLVTTSNGELRGATNEAGSVRSFLGVPYAQPPTGANKWRPSQRVSAWSGVRDARAFGHASAQFPTVMNSIYCAERLTSRLSHWPAYTATDPVTMVIDVEWRLGELPDQDRLRFWNSYYETWRGQSPALPSSP